MAGSGRPVKWAIGIITAPRQQDHYLERTLESFTSAGWGCGKAHLFMLDDFLHVFAEPGSPRPSWFQGYWHQRPKLYGDWTNWATALYELFLSNPDADYFFMAEDDGVYCKGMREYLEKTLPSLGEFASASPYCPGRYHKAGFCGYHDECVGSLTWSTLTVIMPQKSVLSFFSDPDVQRHRFENIFTDEPGIKWGVEVEIQNSVKDAVIGKWAKKNRLPMFYHTPSLAAHLGVYSTLHEHQTSWENLAQDFIGEDQMPNWDRWKVHCPSRLAL